MKTPEKNIKILELIKAGYYPTKMAKLLNISLVAVLKKLKKLEAQNIIEKHKGKPTFYTIKKASMHTHNLTIEQHRPVKIHSTHKVKLSISYRGNQPLQGATAIRPFGRYKTGRQAVFKTGKITIVAFKNKLNIWVHQPKGELTKEQLINAKAEGYLALVNFAKEHDLRLEGYLDRVLRSHHVVENRDVTEVFKPVIEEYEQDIKERIGTKVCKTSHKGKIEHEGIGRPDRIIQGSEVAKGLEYLLLKFPNDFANYSSSIGLYDKNIQRHLEVLERMNKANKGINEGIKKLNKLIAEYGKTERL